MVMIQVSSLLAVKALEINITLVKEDATKTKVKA
jgi:hypothetical protein